MSLFKTIEKLCVDLFSKADSVPLMDGESVEDFRDKLCQALANYTQTSAAFGNMAENTKKAGPQARF